MKKERKKNMMIIDEIEAPSSSGCYEMAPDWLADCNGNCFITVRGKESAEPGDGGDAIALKLPRVASRVASPGLFPPVAPDRVPSPRLPPRVLGLVPRRVRPRCRGAGPLPASPHTGTAGCHRPALTAPGSGLSPPPLLL